MESHYSLYYSLPSYEGKEGGKEENANFSAGIGQALSFWWHPTGSYLPAIFPTDLPLNCSMNIHSALFFCITVLLFIVPG